MGLFDFLHGGRQQKSEAQEYMEQRNKTFASRANQYLNNNNPYMSSSHTDPKTGKQQTLDSAMSLATEMLKVPTAILSTLTGKDVAVSQQTIHKTQTAYHNATTSKRNDACLMDNPNISTKRPACEFVISHVMYKPETRTLITTGEIKAGGFEAGDKVKINSEDAHSDALVISKIIRRGEVTSYANIASGRISIVFNNTITANVKTGDKLIKSVR